MINYDVINELIQQQVYYKSKYGYCEYNRHRVVKAYNNLYPNDPIELEDLHGYVSQDELKEMYLLKNDGSKPVALMKEPSLRAKTMTSSGDGSISMQGVIDPQQFMDSMLESPESLLIANGRDPQRFVVTKHRISQTANGSYTYSIEMKPKGLKDLDAEELLRHLNASTFTAPKINYRPHSRMVERAIEIDMADLHIGSAYFNKERYYESLINICRYIVQHQAEKVYLCLMGDVLHVDNVSETTDKGTQLSTVRGPYEMVDEAMEILIETILRLGATAPELEVLWVQGNHSRLAEYTLIQGVAYAFRQEPHVTFNVDSRRRKAFLYGKTLVGIHHGDMPKKNRFDWLQFDYSELWGQAKYWEMHNGHFHSEEAETRGRLVSRTVTTIKQTDEYETNLGYSNGKPSIMVFRYEKDNGLKGIEYF